jgi:5-methylcytosine-specific restriction endonuclease McrA
MNFGPTFAVTLGRPVRSVDGCSVGTRWGIAGSKTAGRIMVYRPARTLNVLQMLKPTTREFCFMPTKGVRVLLNEENRPVRIFRDRTWRDFPEGQVVEMTKAEAVGSIREQVFDFARNPLTGQFECRNCGRIITWKSGEMNELIPKGSGGEVSLENCEALCNSCHQTGANARHSDRRWQTAKLSPTKGPA